MKTGSIAAGLLAIALLAPTGAAEPLVNQIENDGFEEWESENDPAEWRVIEGPVSNTSEVAEGEAAAKLSVKGTDLLSAIGQNVSLEREDAIVPAQEYDLEFEAKLGQGAGDSPDAEGVVIWKNALGEETDRDTIDVGPNSTYQSYAETFRAPADATEAEIQFSLSRDEATDQTDAEFFVDAVAFGPSNPAE